MFAQLIIKQNGLIRSLLLWQLYNFNYSIINYQLRLILMIIQLLVYIQFNYITHELQLDNYDYSIQIKRSEVWLIIFFNYNLGLTLIQYYGEIHQFAFITRKEFE
jgi:hypothetical protein